MKLFLTILFLAATLPLVVRADDTNPPPRLTFELRDGSRVVGTSVGDSFKFHSALLGDLKLAVKDIRSVDCTATNVAKLTTSNGDTLTVEFAGTIPGLKTSFGEIKLSTDSVRRLSVSSTSPSSQREGLVALWSGENEGRDSVGGHDAQVSPGIKILPGQAGESFSFDGRANNMMVPDAPDLNFGAGQDFSIEAWIQPLPPPPFATDDIMSIVDKRVTPNSTRCHGYEFNLYQGRVHCRLSDSLENNGNHWGPLEGDLRDGRFHHLVLSVKRDSTTGGKIFVDGKVVSTFDPTSVPGDLTSSEPVHIGNHPDPNYHCYFKGLIREIAIYRRALSEDEVRDDYDSVRDN